MSATKCAEIVKEIGAEIRNGEHGAPGTAFMTVRELCDVFDISLVTAQRIVNRLKEDGLLVRSGRRTSIARWEPPPLTVFPCPARPAHTAQGSAPAHC